jgi:hypothetical protein
MHCTGFDAKLRYYPEILLQGPMKIVGNLRIAGVRSEIRTDNLRNTNVGRHRYISPLSYSIGFIIYVHIYFLIITKICSVTLKRLYSYVSKLPIFMFSISHPLNVLS